MLHLTSTPEHTCAEFIGVVYIFGYHELNVLLLGKFSGSGDFYHENTKFGNLEIVTK